MSASRAKRKDEFRRFVRVALPVPIFQTFTYGVPKSLDRIMPGCRVWVRFGKRIGCCPDKHFGGHGDFFSALEPAVITHGFYHRKQLHGVEVEHFFAPRVIAECLMVS